MKKLRINIIVVRKMLREKLDEWGVKTNGRCFSKGLVRKIVRHWNMLQSQKQTGKEGEGRNEYVFL